jgi:hypothetical protein
MDIDDCTVGTEVIDEQYGSGVVLGTVDGTVMVEFDRAKRKDVDPETLREVPPLLLPTPDPLDVGNEWADEAPSVDEDPLYGGEVEIELEFNDDVDIGTDIDVHGLDDDGTYTITLQYWED